MLQKAKQHSNVTNNSFSVKNRLSICNNSKKIFV